MKKIISVIMAVILSISVLLCSVPTYAFRVDSTFGASLYGTNWMSGIRDDVLLSDISMPGTHDSGARLMGATPGAAQCQGLTIRQQLNAGVRYLDMRLEYDTSVSGSVRVVHGIIDCLNDSGGPLTLDSVINDCYQFLRDYPTETIIMSVKEDDGSNTQTLANVLMDKFYANQSYWYLGSSIPKLKDVRKKIVLAKRISQIYGGLNLSWGDQGSNGSMVQVNSSLTVQDRYNMGANAKWQNAAKPMIASPKPAGMFYLNFLSSTGGSLIPNPSGTANEMNSSFLKYPLANNKCYGIIIFDFVNETLAKKVYQCNDLISRVTPSPTSGEYYYRLNVNTSNCIDSNWSRVSLKLYYKSNNGTGTEYSKTIFENDSGETSGYQFVCANRNSCFSGILKGFPTRLEFIYRVNGGHLVMDFDMYISDSINGTQHKIIEDNIDQSGSLNVTKNFVVASENMPTPTEIHFDGDSKVTYTAPKVASDTYRNVFSARIYDQYGVSWNDSPTSYYLKTSLTGVTLVDNSLTITNKFNNNKTQRTVFVCAAYEKNGFSMKNESEKQLVIYPNEIDYTFLNWDDSVIYTDDDYAGVVPTYVGETPVKPFTESEHYVFTGWYPQTALSLSNTQYRAQYTPQEHSFYEYGVAPQEDTEAKLRHHCTVCEYYYDTEYNVDNSTLVAALLKAENLNSKDYTDESLNVFKEYFNEYSQLVNNYPTQQQVDDAVRNILNSITELVPYLSVRVNAENGSFSVAYNDNVDNAQYHSLLFGTNVTVTSTPKSGYRFVGWFDNTTNCYVSTQEEYSFAVTSNTSVTAKYVKSDYTLLTFANESGQIQLVVAKTPAQWSSVATLNDLLPDVPYKAGCANGRWVYDDADALSKLQAGECVTIYPEYDAPSFENPAIPTPVDNKPALNLYYRYDAENVVGSFAMALAVPEGVTVESVGIGFYFADAEVFNPANFELTINNKLQTGRFNLDSLQGVYVANMHKFTADKNWAVRGYVTYYDENNALKVAYTNQINVVNSQEV